MKPNHSLINALRSTANDIESNPTSYNWGYCDRCIVGLLAQKLGVTEKELKELPFGTWFPGSQTFSEHPVFQKLGAHGIELSDYLYLEGFKINALTTDLNMRDRSNPLAVVNFYRDIARTLEAQLRLQQIVEAQMRENKQKVLVSV